MDSPSNNTMPSKQKAVTSLTLVKKYIYFLTQNKAFEEKQKH